MPVLARATSRTSFRAFPASRIPAGSRTGRASGVAAPKRMPVHLPAQRRKDRSMDEEMRSRAPLYVRSALSDADTEGPTSLATVLIGVAAASCGAFSFGYHLGVVNGPLQAIAADLGFAGNAGLQGLVVSSSLAGAAVGSLGGSGLADTLGRRKAFLLDCVPLMAGAVLCSGATSLAALLAGRVLVGVGIGLSSALVPLYISEIAPTRLRGALGSVNQLMICVGILAALLVNVALPSSAWRTMFALSAALPALLAAGMLLSPESPSWLVLSGQRAAAEGVARQLWGPAGPAQLGSGPTGGASKSEARWSEVFASRGALIGMVIFLLQQFSGINAIVYFSSSVFAKAGIASGALASAAVGAVNVLGSAAAAGLMDRAGRKQLLGISFSGMGVAMLAMALGLTLPSMAGVAGPVALVGTLAYILCFAVGAGPVPGLLVPEITPARVRGRAVALAMGSHWVCNFVVGQVFLGAVEAVGVAGVYTFFAGVCFTTVAFVKRFVVETSGRSLEDIESAMAGA